MARIVELARESAPESSDRGSVYFVGTATVLIRWAGLTLLTDPNFLCRGQRVHLGYGLTSKRLSEPAMTFDELPPIDLVLLSHFHEDHFDRLVAERLDRTLPIVTTPHAAMNLRERGFSAVQSIRTWETIESKNMGSRVRVTAMPGRHGPGPIARLLPPVMGSLLELVRPDGVPYRIYISGDTLVHDALYEIPKRYPGIDLALLHLGGTRVAGIVVTMDSEEGLRALQIVSPKLGIPIHYDDYDRFRSPLSDFQRAVESAGMGDRIHVLDRGDTYNFELRPKSLERAPALGGV